MTKSINAHTENIPSEFDKEHNLFYSDGLYYLIGSNRKMQNHKKLF